MIFFFGVLSGLIIAALFASWCDWYEGRTPKIPNSPSVLPPPPPPKSDRSNMGSHA